MDVTGSHAKVIVGSVILIARELIAFAVIGAVGRIVAYATGQVARASPCSFRAQLALPDYEGACEHAQSPDYGHLRYRVRRSSYGRFPMTAHG